MSRKRLKKFFCSGTVSGTVAGNTVQPPPLIGILMKKNQGRTLIVFVVGFEIYQVRTTPPIADFIPMVPKSDKKSSCIFSTLE